MRGGNVTAGRRHDPIELLAGVVLLVMLAGLITGAVVSNGREDQSGYRLTAQFGHIDGLDIGSDVRLAGVAIGQVVKETVNPTTYQAVVTMTIRRDIKLPTDTSVVVTSDSLLGGKYLAVSPGGAETTLQPGGRIEQTQGSISLEQLLSKFILSVTNAASAKKQPTQSGGLPQP